MPRHISVFFKITTVPGGTFSAIKGRIKVIYLSVILNRVPCVTYSVVPAGDYAAVNSRLVHKSVYCFGVAYALSSLPNERTVGIGRVLCVFFIGDTACDISVDSIHFLLLSFAAEIKAVVDAVDLGIDLVHFRLFKHITRVDEQFVSALTNISADTVFIACTVPVGKIPACGIAGVLECGIVKVIHPVDRNIPAAESYLKHL